MRNATNPILLPFLKFADFTQEHPHNFCWEKSSLGRLCLKRILGLKVTSVGVRGRDIKTLDGVREI